MDWVKSNWLILAFIATSGIAWGQQQQKVANLETILAQHDKEKVELRVISERSIRQEEQLNAIRQSQQKTEELLNAIVTTTRSIARNTK